MDLGGKRLMPQKRIVCVYCQKPTSLDWISPTMTPYHGECRVEHLRHQWKTSNDTKKELILDEVRCIESSRPAP